MTVFQEAGSHVDRVTEFVVRRAENAARTAERFQNRAEGIMNALASFRPAVGGYGPGEPPNSGVNIKADISLPEIDATKFGTIDAKIPTMPELSAIPGIGDLDIPEFESKVPGLVIPDAPEPNAPPDAPERPNIPTHVDVPNKPTVSVPNLPVLDDVSIPDFDFDLIPTFDETEPEFEGSVLPAILQWSNPEYLPVIIDEMVEKLREMWAGGSGLPPLVEQAMWERANSREDLTLRRAVSQVSTEFSSLGFTMPSGMQAARVDALIEDDLIRRQGLQRELTIQIAQWQIENLRFACEQAVAAENVYINIFENAANRMFEAAKLQVQFNIDIVNAQIALFNARQSAYQIRATVFKAKLEAALAILKAQLESALAKGQLNEQRVKVFSATLDGLRMHVELYRAEMEGAKVQAELIREQIEAYKADVMAYGERVQADKLRFDAYESRMRGETAKATMLDAEARAFAAIVSGKSKVADIDVKRAELVVQHNLNALKAYDSQLEAIKTRMAAQRETIEAGVRAYIANTERFAAEATAKSEVLRAEVAAQEAIMRSSVALYESRTRIAIARLESDIAESRVRLEAITQAGHVASTMAAGAMAGISSGATISGQGNVSASGQLTESFTWNMTKD